MVRTSGTGVQHIFNKKAAYGLLFYNRQNLRFHDAERAHTEAFIQNLPSQVVTILIHRLLSFYTIFVLILMFLRVFVNDYRKSQNMVMHTFFETFRGGIGQIKNTGTPKLK